MKPQVSVVLPTYNRIATLPRAIRSVLSQTFRDFELLVVDDGSTDGTAGLVAKLDDSRIRYIRTQERRGAAAARNAGIALARAPLIAFQDSDDEWASNKLQEQMRVLASCSREVGIVYCGVLRNEGGACSYIPHPSNYPWRDGNVQQVVPRQNLAPPTTWVVRRECFDKVGLFDDKLQALEDWDWMIRFSRQFQIKLLDEPLVMAYQSPDSLSLDHAKLAQSLTLIIRKNEEQFVLDSPAGLAYLHLMAGARYCLQGLPQAGRAHFTRGMTGVREDVKLWGAWLLSFAGARVFERVWRAVRQSREARFPGTTPGAPRTPPAG